MSKLRNIILTTMACATMFACSKSPEQTQVPIDSQSTQPKTEVVVEPSPTNLPEIVVDFYYPNDSTPLEELVLLRGEEYLFNPSAKVDGGVGELSFEWEWDGNPDTIESTLMDPDSKLLNPGEYFPVLRIHDEAGQEVTLELPKVVKVGDPITPNWKYGVAAHINNTWELYQTKSSIIESLDIIAESGIEAIRVDFPWIDIEQEDDEFYWDSFDKIVDLCEERELEIVAIVGYSPYWASTNKEEDDFAFYPPKNAEEFGEFIKEASSRYKGRVNTWEIWNEPNLSLFFKGYDPEVYFPLLEEAFISAKYGDPNSIVLIGGLANDPDITGLPGMNPEEFLEKIYILGGEEYSDAAAIHPYTDPYQGLSTLRDRITPIREIMDENGAIEHLLWIGEIGYPTGFQYWSEELMADWLTKSYTEIENMERIGPIIWYNFRDKGTDPNDGEHHFGLVTRNFEPKLTLQSYIDYIHNQEIKE